MIWIIDNMTVGIILPPTLVEYHYRGIIPSGAALLHRHEHDHIIATTLIHNTENMKHSPNADLMLGQRRRRWTNIKPALGQ